jgi:putative DNA primase/helicase
MRADIKTECTGKWAQVLIDVGYHANLFNGKHQPCTYCGGKDRARWNKVKEFLICNACGVHQPMEMAMYMLNTDYKGAAQHIRPLDAFKMEAVKTEAPDLDKRKYRLSVILKGCKRITADSVAAKYFAGRCITEIPKDDCYFHPGLDYFNDKGERRGEHPAIVSRIRTAEGEISSFQVLYLTTDGKKLNTPDCRKILPVIAPMKGGAIRLYPATDILCIAEGLESAMSVRIDTGLPVWSAVNAGNMESIIIPESVKHVNIFADSDESFTGQKSAYALAKRLKIEGGRDTVKVINLIDQEQVIDSGIKYDFNDYIILQSEA